MKTLLKNRLRIILNFFAIIPIRPVVQKKGILAGAEERGTRLSSDRDGRIYRLAVLFYNLVISRRGRELEGKEMYKKA